MDLLGQVTTSSPQTLQAPQTCRPRHHRPPSHGWEGCPSPGACSKRGQRFPSAPKSLPGVTAGILATIGAAEPARMASGVP